MNLLYLYLEKLTISTTFEIRLTLPCNYIAVNSFNILRFATTTQILKIPENRESREFPGRELSTENCRKIPRFGNPDADIWIDFTSWRVQGVEST